jgi:adenosyl cobinamide kinase/adenosyl cobinamide phosphate guanylyltransferase
VTLIVGGHGQGKLAYALKQTGGQRDSVARTPETAAERPIWTGLETWLKTTEDPWPALEELLKQNPAVIILCDEVGCGVVPMERAERAWRERVGRVCCELARRADRVERLCCGLPVCLKGETAWS